MSVIKKLFVLTILSQLIFSQDFSITLNVSGGTSNYDLMVGFSPDATDDFDSDLDILLLRLHHHQVSMQLYSGMGIGTTPKY